MIKTLIIYSSVDGHTKKISHYIEDALKNAGHSVAVFTIDDINFTIAEYDRIIIASSVRYGKHNTMITEFIQENTLLLNSKKAALISVNLVARKEEKSQPDTNPYVIKLLNSISWKPTITAVLAGRLNYKAYSFTDRILIKLIMLITKGPTDSTTDIEYTDWGKVDKFVRDFSEL